jgi:hypothetical protein
MTMKLKLWCDDVGKNWEDFFAVGESVGSVMDTDNLNDFKQSPLPLSAGRKRYLLGLVDKYYDKDDENKKAEFFNLTTSSELKDLRKTSPDSEKQAKEPSKTKRKRAKRNDSNYDEE